MQTAAFVHISSVKSYSCYGYLNYSFNWLLSGSLFLLNIAKEWKSVIKWMLNDWFCTEFIAFGAVFIEVIYFLLLFI